MAAARRTTPSPEGRERCRSVETRRVRRSRTRGAESVAQAGEWIADVVASQDDDDEICVWIGVAGFSGATARGISERLGPSMRALGKQMEETDRQCEIFISNDAVALLKAPPLMGASVVAIVGTGSVVMGAHSACPDGVVKRGGYEWLVSDEGSGVWMTLESIRLLLSDIEARSPLDYHSALLDRLADHVGVSEAELADIAASHVALAKRNWWRAGWRKAGWTPSVSSVGSSTRTSSTLLRWNLGSPTILQRASC